MSAEGGAVEPRELRKRLAAQDAGPRLKEEKRAQTEAEGEEEVERRKQDKKTYGRTPNGTIFTVPRTHDMVSQLLDPRQPKNISDLIVLAVLACLILTLYWLPAGLRVPVFAVIFLFWRAGYNVGLGVLLQLQSKDKMLVRWAEKSHIFEKPSSGRNPHPHLYEAIKRELETKIPQDYDFEQAPIEYNTWLVFRRVVDLILMCDFVSYCLFALACGGRPAGESIGTTVARWSAGVLLFLFNLWVKLDAHRVVKDYAWYWGDFFFLIDQELTFDGVFEMAPHPMYSIGYAGYYGISLMAASYKVLFISIVAHAAQFAFLTLVENPHIDKTYNSPPPTKRAIETSEIDDRPLSSRRSSESQSQAATINAAPSLASTASPSPVHNLLGWQNIDLHRVTDVSVLLLQLHILCLAAFTPSTAMYKAFFLFNALLWRLWYSLGIGYILNRQSNKKKWTRHFIRYGESTEEAWRQWKGLYHISMTMFYASFVAAAWKMYSMPPDWTYGMALLRHVVGVALISLQIWTSVSIYDSLGEFGWFFGDFFFDHAPKLTYSGIYRFLNNPERVLGLAGVWGFAIITWSKSIFFLALLSHVLTLAFLQFVERPHMQKLYGQSVRQDSGLSKSLRRSLPQPIRQWQGSIDRVLSEAVESLEEVIEAAHPRLTAGVGTFIKDTTRLLKSYPARLSITTVAPDMAGFDPKDYGVSIEGTPTSHLASLDKLSGREGELARSPAIRTSDFNTLMFEYGTPIKVRWTAPPNHSRRDWIGLYMVSDNAARDVTRVSTQGRWIATNPRVYDSSHADQGILLSEVPVAAAERTDGSGGEDCVAGEMEFRGDKLWWTTGVFEFRYHHDGKHNVMAISLPFEIRIGRFDEDDVVVSSNSTAPGATSGGGADALIRSAIETALLPVVRNCFDRNADVAPRTVDDRFGKLVEKEGKYAKRVVFAVHQMFGIEFAPEVVVADGSVRNLAWRICGAKMVLAPYSMSRSKGTTTPDGTKR